MAHGESAREPNEPVDPRQFGAASARRARTARTGSAPTPDFAGGSNPLEDWRNDPPTPGQMACAERLGVRCRPGIRRGELSDLLLAKMGLYDRRRFQFSLRKLLLWMTGAALLLGGAAPLGPWVLAAGCCLILIGAIRAATNRVVAGVGSTASVAMTAAIAAYVAARSFWPSFFAGVFGAVAGAICFVVADAFCSLIDSVDSLMEARNRKRNYRY